MKFEPNDIVQLVDALAWPTLILLFILMYGESIRNFLYHLTKHPLKSVSTPWVSAIFEEGDKALEKAIAKGQKSKKNDKPKGVTETGAYEAESFEGMASYDLKVWIAKNEYEMALYRRMIEWILANNNGFTDNLTDQTMKEFAKNAINEVKERYPDIFINPDSEK